MIHTTENLHWRYATKGYDATKKLSDEQRQAVLDALRLSPSSMGLQPWKFIHVTDTAIREKLRSAAYNQPQLTEASDIIVLASRIGMDEAYVDLYLKSVAEIREMPVEGLVDYRKMLMGAVNGRSQDALTEWSARQVYIALGIALAVAAELRIDATPMEGFDPKQVDEILGLSEYSVTSRVILALGFRSSEDKLQFMKKARFAVEDVIIKK